jgi:hypothetical protein
VYLVNGDLVRVHHHSALTGGYEIMSGPYVHWDSSFRSERLLKGSICHF